MRPPSAAGRGAGLQHRQRGYVAAQVGQQHQGFASSVVPTVALVVCNSAPTWPHFHRGGRGADFQRGVDCHRRADVYFLCAIFESREALLRDDDSVRPGRDVDDD